MRTETLRKEIRIRAAQIICKAKSSHIGGVFSCADILAVLYGEILRRDVNGFLDSFILSKGHCGAGVYAALNCLGMLSDEKFRTYGMNKSDLMTHISHKVKHVEFSTGSLGHGLSFGIGKAIACKQSNTNKSIYVLMSDGELDEGSNWEAIHFAGFNKIEHLTAIVDYNKLQSLDTTYNTLDLEPLVDKLEAFRWEVINIDGHNLAEIRNACLLKRTDKPRIIISNTIKGYPISFMTNLVEWHYKPPSEDQLKTIISEIHDW